MKKKMIHGNRKRKWTCKHGNENEHENDNVHEKRKCKMKDGTCKWI